MLPLKRTSFASFLLTTILSTSFATAQETAAPKDPAVEAIHAQMKQLRATPDAERGTVTSRLAKEIRELPAGMPKLRLAYNLCNLSTEGDFGQSTLQEVATTLQQALNEQPQPRQEGRPAAPYTELATLVRYEHVSAALDDGQFQEALRQLEADDQAREQADFTATDLAGRTWHLKELKGKVVLINFWATWCPPCRKEMPDLEQLSKEFAAQGLVILAFSDETEERVKPFLAKQGITYPVLIDKDSALHKAFRVEGIPKSFVFNREGKLSDVAIDMRTRGQFLRMLERAGLQVPERAH